MKPHQMTVDNQSQKTPIMVGRILKIRRVSLLLVETQLQATIVWYSLTIVL